MPGREVTPAIVEKIAQWEGVILYAYDDAIYPTRPARPGDRIHGTLTVGAGHTGSDVYIGQTLTEAEAMRLLALDLRDSEAAVIRYVRPEILQLLTDNQFGTLVDFVFNCGASAFAGSTLLRRLNAGDFAAVPAELGKWVYTTVNGQKVKSNGLVARRAHEAALWAEGAVPAPMQLPTAVGTTPPESHTAKAGAAGAAVVAGAAVGAPWLGWMSGSATVGVIVAVLVVAAAGAFFLYRTRNPLKTVKP
jgi:lysozyme